MAAGSPASRKLGGETVSPVCFSEEEGGGHIPGLQNPSRPRSLPRLESQNPRSRGRSTRCRRRHGCHDESEVRPRATAAGSLSWSPGFPAAAARRSATRRTADSLCLCEPIPSARGLLPPRLEWRGVAPVLRPRQRERWRTRPSATSK